MAAAISISPKPKIQEMKGEAQSHLNHFQEALKADLEQLSTLCEYFSFDDRLGRWYLVTFPKIIKQIAIGLESEVDDVIIATYRFTSTVFGKLRKRRTKLREIEASASAILYERAMGLGPDMPSYSVRIIHDPHKPNERFKQHL